MQATLHYHCYLLRIKDYWVRLVFHRGAKRHHRKYLRTLGTDIEFLGSLPLPIKYDIDVQVGQGTKVVNSFTVISCKHVRQMITQDLQEQTLVEYQRSSIVRIRRGQEDYIDAKILRQA